MDRHMIPSCTAAASKARPDKVPFFFLNENFSFFKKIKKIDSVLFCFLKKMEFSDYRGQEGKILMMAIS